ncbi:MULTISPECIES: SEFIR domain-containing protein [unclassified Amycolatopsis]|uniref:SEFIR domain-containing protein n=1 Tax=unclassified Amycolatopsis TaxID=2618356 RepID=UPI002875DBB3|nr:MULTISPECIES: SEFIR domain-containing protein [unclassified Amycolatopsis]MDS0135732.1 TIR domain-containing protein [Amycolatopsis sp. 505]MDS0145667.1 TIR domain-containing protein [Amycolatopsis sp. CM201R]
MANRYDSHQPGDHPKVFVSYTHDSEEHREAVLAFADFLVRNGIDVVLDRWATDRRRDWQAWMTRNITESDHVLVIASEGYRRMGDGIGPNHLNLGGQAEAALLRDRLQGDRATWTAKILPVLLPGHGKHEIPDFLLPNAADWYEVPANTPEAAESLLRVLTRQPRDLPPALGPRPILPPRSGSAPARITIPGGLPVVWRPELLPAGYQSQGPLVEVHLVPASPFARYGVLQLERIADELAASGRAKGLFSQAQAISVGSSADAAWAFSTDWSAGECGLAVLRGGQRTCWFPPAKASIGWILDRADLSAKVADRLDLLLQIGLPFPETFATAIALDPVGLTRLGHLSEADARSAALPLDPAERIRVGTEEAFLVEELRSSAQNVAEELAARLVVAFKR